MKTLQILLIVRLQRQDGPAEASCALAQVYVLIVKEEVPVQAAKLVQAFAPQEKAAAGYPGYPAATAGLQQMILAAGAWQRQPRQCLKQGW